MDAYAGSVRFSGQEPSQIWNFKPKQIPSQYRQQLTTVSRAYFKELLH